MWGIPGSKGMHLISQILFAKLLVQDAILIQISMSTSMTLKSSLETILLVSMKLKVTELGDVDEGTKNLPTRR